MAKLKHNDADERKSALDAFRALPESVRDIYSQEVVDLLQDLFRDDNADVRKSALEALRLFGTNVYVLDNYFQQVVNLLNDGDAGVRKAAVQALQLLTPKTYKENKTNIKPSIIDMLGDGNQDVRKAAFDTLWELKKPSSRVWWSARKMGAIAEGFPKYKSEISEWIEKAAHNERLWNRIR